MKKRQRDTRTEPNRQSSQKTSRVWDGGWTEEKLRALQEAEENPNFWKATNKRAVFAGTQVKLQEFTNTLFYGGTRRKPIPVDPVEKDESLEHDAQPRFEPSGDPPKGWGRSQEADEDDKKANRQKVASRNKELVWGYSNANPDLNRFLTLTHSENVQDLSVANKDLTNFWKRVEREAESLFKHYVIYAEITLVFERTSFRDCPRYLSQDKQKGLVWCVEQTDGVCFDSEKDAERFLQKHQKLGNLPPYDVVRVVESDPFELKYLAVPEFQGRGAIHYHCLVNTPYFPQTHAIVADCPQEDGGFCLHYLSKTGGFLKVASRHTIRFRTMRDAVAFVDGVKHTLEHSSVKNLRVKKILTLQLIWGLGHVDIRTVDNLRKCKGVSDIGGYMSKYLSKTVDDHRFEGKKKVFHSRNLEKPEVVLDEDEIRKRVELMNLSEVVARVYMFENEWLGTVTVTLFNTLFFRYPWLRSRRQKLNKASAKRKKKSQKVLKPTLPSRQQDFFLSIHDDVKEQYHDTAHSL